MPAITSSAPGKIILFGEHAVVYGRRAIAIPVQQARAKVILSPLITAKPGTIHVVSPDMLLDSDISLLPAEHPIRKAVTLTLANLGISTPPAFSIQINSTIPIAGGMGSGAAVSTAIIRGVSTYLGKQLSADAISALAFEVEKIHHGTPSGIDNTVIAHEKAILFQKGETPTFITPGEHLHFVIASTGIKSSTALAVSKVRQKWMADQDHFEDLFSKIDQITQQAYQSILAGDPEFVGKWMTENHTLLQQIGVSCPQLDQLVTAATLAGAFGAKLTGAGDGGNMIALVNENNAQEIARYLSQAGAVQTIITRLE